jgi:oligopeptide transport system substrate-binding protein
MFFILNLFSIIAMLLPSCQTAQPQQNLSTLNLNFQVGDVPSLSPHFLIDSRGRVLGKLLYEGLTRIDRFGSPQLAGAQNIEISPDGTQYTFTLRKQCWSDGSPVTAEHYVASWQHALNPRSDTPRPDLFYLLRNGRKAKKGEVAVEQVGVRALNAQTLIINLEYPSSHFLHLLAHPMFVPLKDPLEEPKVFNGPFIIKNWEKGNRLTLVPNNYFWNRDAVQLSQINISCVTDAATAFYMYEKQQIDWIGDPIDPVSQETATQLIERGHALFQSPDRFYWIYLNLNHPILRSAKIRKALYLSIQREQIINYICYGEAMLTPLPQSMIPYIPEKENLNKAKQLFKEGLEELKLNETPTLILSYAKYANMKALSEYLKNSWEGTLGLNIQLQVNEWNVLRQNLERGNFEMGGRFEFAFYGDALELLERFSELSHGNYCQWENETFKHKLALIKQEKEEDKQIGFLIDAEKILIDETPFIPVFRATNIYTHHPKLKEYVFDTSGCVDFAYSRFDN